MLMGKEHKSPELSSIARSDRLKRCWLAGVWRSRAILTTTDSMPAATITYSTIRRGDVRSRRQPSAARDDSSARNRPQVSDGKGHNLALGLVVRWASPQYCGGGGASRGNAELVGYRVHTAVPTDVERSTDVRGIAEKARVGNELSLSTGCEQWRERGRESGVRDV